MDIIQLVGLGLGLGMIILLVSTQDKTYASLIRLLGTIILLGIIVPQIQLVIDMVVDLGERINLDDTYLVIVLKIIGVAYITEFGYQLCKDIGEESIGGKIQLGGKLMILVIATPVAMALIEIMATLL